MQQWFQSVSCQLHTGAQWCPNELFHCWTFSKDFALGSDGLESLIWARFSSRESLCLFWSQTLRSKGGSLAGSQLLSSRCLYRKLAPGIFMSLSWSLHHWLHFSLPTVIEPKPSNCLMEVPLNLQPFWSHRCLCSFTDQWSFHFLSLHGPQIGRPEPLSRKVGHHRHLRLHLRPHQVVAWTHLKVS